MRHKPVTGCKSPEEATKAIAFPKELKTDDGRVLMIRSWATTIGIDQTASVKLEALIVIPD